MASSTAGSAPSSVSTPDLGQVTDAGEADPAELDRVGDHDGPTGLLHHHPVDSGLALVVRGHAGGRVDPGSAEEAEVGGEPAQRLAGDRPDQLIGLRTGDAAADDDLDVGAER